MEELIHVHSMTDSRSVLLLTGWVAQARGTSRGVVTTLGRHVPERRVTDVKNVNTGLTQTVNQR